MYRLRPLLAAGRVTGLVLLLHAQLLVPAVHRAVAERTFAWLGRHRRLSKDYEALPDTEEAWIYLAMVRLMVARLAS